MDPNQQAQQRDAFLRELERKSLDTFMVYNPTTEDFLVEWDKRFHRVPAKNKDMGFGLGKMELTRYLTEKYARTMKDNIINKKESEFMATLREKKEIKGEPFRDKYEEHTAALQSPNLPKTNSEELISKIYNEIILGLVREFGKDSEMPTLGEIMDTKTPEEKVLENMNKKYMDTTEVLEVKKTPEYPINKKAKSDVLSGVAA